ncbi:MAG: hypothetical protein MJZ30_01220 [Paludibacteraceae bacterium]|nr:hypothetical protein [Paludibacteraceae bacterium]
MKQLYSILFLISSYCSVWACDCICSTDSLYKDVIGHLIFENVEALEKAQKEANEDSMYHHIVYVIRDNKERLKIDSLNGYKVIQPFSIDRISREYGGFHIYKMKSIAFDKDWDARFYVKVEEYGVRSKDWKIVGGASHVFCYKYSESTNCFSYLYCIQSVIETWRLDNLKDDWNIIFK